MAIERFSTINILVNNAGIHSEKIGHLSTEANFTQCLDVNLIGVWRMSQALVPHFRGNRTGKIINIASINGRTPWADTPAYSASKAAVINLTQSLALQLAPYSINVNAICPGGIITSMAGGFTHDLEAMEQEMISRRPLKRRLQAVDVGYAVVFFASDRSRNITGQTLNVDCGVVMS